MPVELSYMDDGSGVHLFGTGNITAQDITDAAAELYSEDVLNRLQYAIVDFALVEKLQASADELREVARRDIEAAARTPGIALAFISSTKAVFGLIRMYEVFADDLHLRTEVFRTMPEAKAWLKDIVSEDLQFE
jgi:quinol monooxygenase YgiN